MNAPIAVYPPKLPTVACLLTLSKESGQCDLLLPSCLIYADATLFNQSPVVQMEDQDMLCTNF